MNAVPYTEPPRYRSLIHLLNLYCLISTLQYFWNVSHLWEYLRDGDAPLSDFLLLLWVPVTTIIMFVVNLIRSRTAHTARLILLVIWIAMGAHFSFSEIGNIEFFQLLPSFSYLFVDSLFFFLLLRLHRTRPEPA